VMRLRRLLKTDPHPFTILPIPRPRATRQQRIVEAIHEAEAELIRQARGRIQSLTQQAMGLGWAGGGNTAARAQAAKKRRKRPRNLPQSAMPNS
jgi:hypothetical protein